MGILSVEIDNFRSFAPGARRIPSVNGESFSPALNLIVGPNGSGKTTILNAISLAFGRDQGNSQGNMKPGFVSDPQSAAEHHNRSSQPLSVAVTFDFGIDAHRGQLRVIHTVGKYPERLLSTEAVPWNVDLLPILQQLHDRCFPMGWPRQIWKLAQPSFKSIPRNSPEFYAKAWERIRSACNDVIGSGLGDPEHITTHCKITCSVCGNEPTRDVVGDDFVDAHGIPLLHSSDGHSHFAYLSLEIEKHEQPTTFLLEEPDVFMHASLQKAFIRYVLDRCAVMGHQFFITTHSPYMIDWTATAARGNSKDIHVYQFRYDRTLGSTVERIKPNDGWDLLEELGHKPSDVLQPNGVIWVEGPSDIYYLRVWLDLWRKEHRKTEIRWGLDCVLLPYGGSNIKYVTAERPPLNNAALEEVEELCVTLKAIAPGVVLVIDQDPGDVQGKRRNKEEARARIEAAGGMVWLSDHASCATVEDYANPALLKEARETRGSDGKLPRLKPAVARTFEALARTRGSLANAINADTDIEKWLITLSDTVDQWRKLTS